MSIRERMIKDIVSKLESDEAILAIWQGGSAATGYIDEYSDLDLLISCEDNYVEDVFKVLEDYFEKNYGILRKFRVPEPAWHGLSQCFYLLDKCPKYYYLDIAIVRRNLSDKFTASDRHGKAIVYFDKASIIDPSPTKAEVVTSKAKSAYKGIIESDFIYILEVKKAIARCDFYEAYPKYVGFLARQLATLLNIKHRPEKVDFGLRYGSRDYSKEDYKLMDKLFRVDNIEILKENFDVALNRYKELKEELNQVIKG